MQIQLRTIYVRDSKSVKELQFRKKIGSEKPSYVVVNQSEKQFPVIGGVLGETSLYRVIRSNHLILEPPSNEPSTGSMAQVLPVL